MSSISPRGGRGAVVDAALLGVASAGWTFAILAWVAVGLFLGIGYQEMVGGTRPPTDLLEGSPPPPWWVTDAWRWVSRVAVLGWALGFARRAWPHRLAVFVFLGLSVVTLFGIVVGTELERMRWVHFRFVNGDPFPPDFAMWMQLLHSYAAVEVMATVLVGSLLLASSRLPREPSAAGFVAATLVPLAACAVATDWLVRSEPEQQLVAWLPELVPPIRIIAGLAFALTASTVLAQARTWPTARLRGQTALAAVLCGSGLIAFAATHRYTSDVARPPTLTPRSRMPRELPWVGHCAPERMGTVLRVAMGRRPRGSMEGGIPGRSVAREAVVYVRRRAPGRAAGPSMQEFRALLRSDRARLGDDQPLRVSTPEIGSPVDALRPYLIEARRLGFSHVELRVAQRVQHHSATFGTIHDRRYCAVTAPIERVLGASTFGEMLERAGADLQPPPPPFRQHRPPPWTALLGTRPLRALLDQGLEGGQPP